MSKEKDAKADGWTWTAAPAVPLNDGRVIVKLLAYDGEYPSSYIYVHPNMQGRGVPILDVDEWLSDMCVTPDGSIYASGEEGQIHVRRKDRWRTLACPDDEDLNCVWAYSDDLAFVAGDGFVVEINGTRTRTVSKAKMGNINALCGTASTLFAAGSAGQLWSFDGNRWLMEDVPTNMDLNCICAAADGTVYAGGDNGVILKGGKEAWELLNGGKHDFLDVLEFAGTIYLASETSGLCRLDGKSLIPVLPDVKATSIRRSDAYLCVTGDMTFHRWDASDWKTYQYKF